MKLKNMAYGHATVVLNSQDSRLLAEACDVAAAATIAAEREMDTVHLETLSSFFQAIVLACKAEWEMTAPQLAVMSAAKQTLGLQDA